MADIIGKDFKMVQVYGTFYDLYKKVIINKDKENEREDYSIVGYGMSFKNCIQEIISWMIEDKEYTIHEYIDAFIEASNKLHNNIDIVKNNGKDNSGENRTS